MEAFEKEKLIEWNSMISKLFPIANIQVLVFYKLSNYRNISQFSIHAGNWRRKREMEKDRVGRKAGTEVGFKVGTEVGTEGDC